MPTATFTLDPVTPTSLTGAQLLANGNIVYSLFPVEDPGNPGAVRIPDLNTMRQSGSQLVKEYTNIDALKDGNGNIVDGSLPSLTGGYFVLRAYANVGGTAVFEAGSIPCAVAWASGFSPDNYVSLDTDSELRLLFDPRPDGLTTTLLDANFSYEDLPAVVLPCITVGSSGGGAE